MEPFLNDLAGRGLAWDGIFHSTTFGGGAVIDTTTASIDLWIPTEFPNAVPRLQESWPGWKIGWHEDKFEEQIKRSNGKLHVLVETRDESIAALRKHYLQIDHERSGAEVTVQVVHALRKSSDIKSVVANPMMLRDSQLRIPLEIRIHIFNDAVAAIAES